MLLSYPEINDENFKCALWIFRQQEYIPVGYEPSTTVAISGGGSAQRGVSVQGDVCPMGCLHGECLPRGEVRPPMDRMTDALENFYCSTINVFVLCLSEYEMYFTI